MQKIITTLPEIKLVGIQTRTNNASEMNPTTAKIEATAMQYFRGGLWEKIAYRKNPGTTYCVYTDYESDFTGDYTYFIGEEVTAFAVDLPEEFSKITVPVQNYAKLTSDPGVIPEIVINAWQQVWKMTPQELGGQRSYHTDFEIYDERAQNHHNAVFDLYIGIKP
ncbi:MAG: hypothetical protein ACD_21C00254G0001 [uncultured bacterium]|nr:MAG: hypothetical protein ACD_21C00254G0001 [uncultured bacterium]